MADQDLLELYRNYIDCLNIRDWSSLGEVVDDDVKYNGEPVGLAGYRAMLERDVAAIPDLSFRIDFLVADRSTVGARLLFDCHPVGELFGIGVDGRRVQFSENVFYQFSAGKISSVWSVIDKAAVYNSSQAILRPKGADT